MTKTIERDRIVPAWLAAARHLSTQTDRIERNLILEIATPTVLSPSDKGIISVADTALRSKHPNLSIQTVAGTIFPNSLYKRHGRHSLYNSYLRIMSRAKKEGTWGTYALRMMRRISRDGSTAYNPLETIITKLHAAHSGRTFRSVYELGVSDIEADLHEDIGYELPIYDPISDRLRPTNIPCLSHLSFKLNNGRVDLTAIYRSHHYAQRALGNLIGLSQLQNFVSAESGHACGTLTCIATHAYLDTETWGGVNASNQLLLSLPQD